MSHQHPIININKEKALCSKCGANILDIANVAYDGKARTAPRYREELFHCRECGTKFIMHYDLFDKDGHICPRVFSEDINIPEFKWQDLLVKEQIAEIATHLESCTICQDRLSEELLSDAWMAAVIHGRKNDLEGNNNGASE